MRISDWSSDVCSSDRHDRLGAGQTRWLHGGADSHFGDALLAIGHAAPGPAPRPHLPGANIRPDIRYCSAGELASTAIPNRSEEHTSELQSLMRISYAVFCLKTKTQ